MAVDTGGAQANFRRTVSDAEDSGSASGWSIGDDFSSKGGSNAWTTSSLGPSVVMAVKGFVGPSGPKVLSASIDEKTLDIVFDEDLDTGSIPAAGAFLVTERAEKRTVSTVAIADATLTLTLSGDVSPTETVLVYYTQPSTNPLRNAAGHKTASFSRQEVTNNTGSGTPSITSVALVSKPRHDAGNDGTKETYGAGQPIVLDVTWDRDVTWNVSASGAQLRVRLNIGGATRTAKLVTGGATSGTARTLRFSYTVTSGVSDSDGVAIVPNASGDLVLLHSGATLKNVNGDGNAGRTHAGLSAQTGHNVDGSVTAPANSAPTFNAPALGSIHSPSGTLVNVVVPFIGEHGAEKGFADADGDTLSIAMSWVNNVYILGTPRIVEGRVFFTARDQCILENLQPALTSPHDEVITFTVSDPDGASVSQTLTSVHTLGGCPSFSSAEVDGETLTLTLDAAPTVVAGHAPADEVLAAGEFTVQADAAPVDVERVVIDDATATLTLAEAVAAGASVTLSYAPRDYPAAVAFTDKTVMNNTIVPGVQSAAVAYANGRTTLTLTFDRALAAVPAPEPLDLRYAFVTQGLWSNGIRLRNISPNRIETNGKNLTLVYNALEALPGREISVSYDEPFAAKWLPSQLLYADAEKVAAFSQTATRPDGGQAIAPVLTSTQVAGTVLTMTFDRALDAGSAPAGSRFRVVHMPWGWAFPYSVVTGTGAAAISGSTVTVTLASNVPQRHFARVSYSKGDEASPLRGASAGPEVRDIWWAWTRALDRDPPQATGSLLAGTSLVVYYDDTLNTGSTPAASAYTVNTAGNNPQAVTVSSVTVHANAVELTLGSAPAGNVTVTYSAPATNPVKDAAGNNAGALNRSVTRQASDPGAPSFASASAAHAELTVSFSQSLDPAHVPANSAFTLSLNDADLVEAGYKPPSVTGVKVLGSDVGLTMNPWWWPCDGTLTVAYAQPATAAKRLKNNWGSEAAAFSKAATNAEQGRCTLMNVKGSIESGGGPGGQSGDDPGGQPRSKSQGESRNTGRATTRSDNPGDESGLHLQAARQALGLNDEPQQPADDDARNATRIALEFDRALNTDSVPDTDAFTVTTHRTGASPVEVTAVEMREDADDKLLLSLSRDLAGGERVTVSYRRPHGSPGLWDTQGNQVADFSVDVTAPGAAPNRPPVFNGAAERLDNALPGFLVSLPMRQSDFSDPDDDPLTFTLSASRDDIYALDGDVPGGFMYNDTLGRVFFLAKTSCALAALDPPDGDAYYTVITMIATDPDGATAEATATFRTDPSAFACPSLASATVDGSAVTLSFDADLAPSYTEPTAQEFTVKADGNAVSVTELSLAGADAGSDTGNMITLTLASPVTAGQSVTVSYAPGGSPVAAAFTDRAADNETPAAQVDYEPDQQVIDDVWSYAQETDNGFDHVHRWMRVLTTFGVVDDMTAAEAQGYADTYLAERWNPVVEELTNLEEAQGDYEPDQEVIDDVWSYAQETYNGFDHVLRWMRVLKTLGVVEDMTAAEAQGYADQYLAERWDPVVEELTNLEASTP